MSAVPKSGASKAGSSVLACSSGNRAVLRSIALEREERWSKARGRGSWPASRSNTSICETGAQVESGAAMRCEESGSLCAFSNEATKSKELGQIICSARHFRW